MPPSNMPRSMFVTGTDTGVGKTVICSILAKGLNAGYWKPIQSGTTDGTDTASLKQSTGLGAEHFYAEAYCSTQPLSPHLSASIDGLHINLENVVLPKIEQEHLIVEGAGGVLVPLNEKDLIIDLISHLAMPTIVVARSGLGTINHTLLTLEKLRDHHIAIIGVVLNGPRNQANAEAISRYGAVDIIAQVEPLGELNPHSLHAAFVSFFGDWYARFSCNSDLSDLASVYANEDSGTAVAGKKR